MKKPLKQRLIFLNETITDRINTVAHRYSGFTIGVSDKNASHGAFHQEKPHFTEDGSGTVIVKPL
jgi:hypothetical protein